MARARNIKPGFFKNEILGAADPLYMILFEGLWVLADRQGRLENRPLRIKAEIFPYRDGLNVVDMLAWLSDQGFVLLYEVAGQKYIEVLNFIKHQNPHKNETDSDIPAPTKGKKRPEKIGGPSENIGKPRSKDGTTHADSLNTDSLNLIPSPGFRDGVGPPEKSTAAGSMAKELRLKGVSITSMHPTLLQWLADGFSLPSALEAVEIARLSKPEPEPIPANYLDRILRNPPKKTEPAWWSSEQRILAKGVELGLSPRPGEEMPQFKERIQAALSSRKVSA